MRDDERFARRLMVEARGVRVKCGGTESFSSCRQMGLYKFKSLIFLILFCVY